MGLKVRALHISDDQKIVGYYNLKRIRAGEEFEIDSVSHFSPFWMEPVGWEAPKKSASDRERERAAYAERLRLAAAGGANAEILREQDKAFAQERDAIRKENPKDVGTLSPQQQKSPANDGRRVL